MANPSPWPPTNSGNSNVLRQTYFVNYIDVSGPTTLRSDSSMNGNVFVSQTIYPTGGINQTSTSPNVNTTVVTDNTAQTRLFVGSDTSLNSNLYSYINTICQGDVSMNSRLFVNGDVSMNSRLFVTSDVSMGGRLFVGNDVFVNGRLNVYQYTNTNIIYTNVTTTNYSLIENEDIRLTGSLYTLTDVSINGITIGLGGGGSNYNVAIGTNALKNNSLAISGVGNIGIGRNTLLTNVDGYQNIAIGDGALKNITIYNFSYQGCQNVAIGDTAGPNTSYGYQNTILGYSALNSMTTGYMNTAIGANSGAGNAIGNYNTYLGCNTSATSNNYGNSTAIGVGSTIKASNQIVLGTTTEYVNIPSTTVSNSTGAGALTIAGGVGIGGKLNIGGSITVGTRPQVWYITGTGGNGATGGGGVYGASFFNSVTPYGGANTAQWNTSTGVFTVPSAGLYDITFCIFNNSPNTSGRNMQFNATGTTLTSQYCSFNNSSIVSNEQTWQWGIMLYFSAGGTFYFNNPGNSQTFYYAATHTTLTITKIY